MALSLRSSEMSLDIKISFNLMNIYLACAVRISISLLLLPSLVIVWPRYLKCSTCLRCFPSTLNFCLNVFIFTNVYRFRFLNIHVKTSLFTYSLHYIKDFLKFLVAVGQQGGVVYVSYIIYVCAVDAIHVI